MRVEITGKNIEVTKPMRNRIIARFKKLEKWQMTLMNPHVVVAELTNKRFSVEASVAVAGAMLVASAEHEDMFAAINEAGQKLEKQINKHAHKGDSRRSEIVEPEVEEDII